MRGAYKSKQKCLHTENKYSCSLSDRGPGHALAGERAGCAQRLARPRALATPKEARYTDVNSIRCERMKIRFCLANSSMLSVISRLDVFSELVAIGFDNSLVPVEMTDQSRTCCKPLQRALQLHAPDLTSFSKASLLN